MSLDRGFFDARGEMLDCVFLGMVFISCARGGKGVDLSWVDLFYAVEGRPHNPLSPPT